MHSPRKTIQERLLGHRDSDTGWRKDAGGLQTTTNRPRLCGPRQSARVELCGGPTRLSTPPQCPTKDVPGLIMPLSIGRNIAEQKHNGEFRRNPSKMLQPAAYRSIVSPVPGPSSKHGVEPPRLPPPPLKAGPALPCCDVGLSLQPRGALSLVPTTDVRRGSDCAPGAGTRQQKRRGAPKAIRATTDGRPRTSRLRCMPQS
ncbi:hypothetical protein NDU88_004884 [Pleurodeles waltl]|uniref:Uncharacterized protein n=1 Tax=Pleurodeles waltl TaxID=8319 RepID=A0AAV7NKQ9_PLEWA|nr:hypothetical protein NDU88_004884 [Pleurodeles waltl]